MTLALILLLGQPSTPAREAEFCRRDEDCGPALVCWSASGERRCVPGCPPRGCPPGAICTTTPEGWPPYLPPTACRTLTGVILP